MISEFSHAHLTILTQGGMPTASRPCKSKKCKTTKNISIFCRAKPKSGEKKSNISKMGGWVGVVLGQVSDRDAQHRPLTRNATMVKKKGGGGGVETIHLPNFNEKKGSKYDIFHVLRKYRGRKYTNFPET